MNKLVHYIMLCYQSFNSVCAVGTCFNANIIHNYHSVDSWLQCHAYVPSNYSLMPSASCANPTVGDLRASARLLMVGLSLKFLIHSIRVALKQWLTT